MTSMLKKRKMGWRDERHAKRGRHTHVLFVDQELCKSNNVSTRESKPECVYISEAQVSKGLFNRFANRHSAVTDHGCCLPLALVHCPVLPHCNELAGSTFNYVQSSS